MRKRLVIICLLAATALGGCSHRGPLLNSLFERPLADHMLAHHEGDIVVDPAAAPPAEHVSSHVAWGEPVVIPAGLKGPQAVADTDGPYLLDTGDKLRVFVYGQPNLSRIYPVDHQGMISVPLIGDIRVRGMTTYGVDATLTDYLGRDYVRDPQVTVDIHENRPFFILGEVKNAGRFPYVSGMTIETAVAIAGGYSPRANDRRFRITRRINGFVETIHTPSDYVVQPGDTVFVYERYF